ncbi:hypothetical protein PU630_09245 [Microbacterium horticulturae]|uniref:Uncharacterized protein n=1 Tax=Microbacterium horticulturae TaxID=3028316 RepID=A0ABY8BTG0_9MICO|nr:hypothetical protein [Microbacterium sp. KACC 23027]WEG07451.1 hypothetical protein PU630_09245 [Microbacterium sp. KACC 23027]
MTSHRTRHIALALSCGALLVALTACGDDSATSAPATPGASAPIAGSQVTPTADATDDTVGDPGTPTCEAILPAETVSAFTDAGWTSRQDPFYVGNTELSDGLQCIWGNPEVASDDVQVYGWAPLSGDEAQQVTDELTAQGWVESEENGAKYFVAPDDAPMGMAYRIAGDELTVSDTKQGLLLIEWPPAG